MILTILTKLLVGDQFEVKIGLNLYSVCITVLTIRLLEITFKHNSFVLPVTF